MSVPTTEPIAQTGTPGQQGGEGQGGAPAAQQQAGNEQQDRTFSQQAVNALIGSRLKEARAQWERETQEKVERDEAEKNGKWQELADKAEKRAAAAEQKVTEIERAARERVLKSEIRSVAVELGFANPAVAHRLVDLSAVAFDDATGEPKNVKPLMEQLAKDEPYLIAGAQQGGNAAIPRTPNASGLTADQFKEQERQRLVRSGKYSAL